MSKKLLNESTIRRFSTIAGIKPATVSTFLKEGEYSYDRDDAMEDESALQEEEEEIEMEADEELEAPEDEGPADLEADAEVDMEDAEMDMETAADEEADDAEGIVMDILDLVKKLADKAGVGMDVEEEGEAEGGEEMMGAMELDADEGGEEVEMEVGEEESLEEMINAILGEEEVVEEEVIEEEDGDEKGDESKTHGGDDYIQESDDQEELVQEVMKRVKARLTKLANRQ